MVWACPNNRSTLAGNRYLIQIKVRPIFAVYNPCHAMFFLLPQFAKFTCPVISVVSNVFKLSFSQINKCMPVVIWNCCLTNTDSQTWANLRSTANIVFNITIDDITRTHFCNMFVTTFFPRHSGGWVRSSSRSQISHQMDCSGSCQLQPFHHQVRRLVIWHLIDRDCHVRPSAVSRFVLLFIDCFIFFLNPLLKDLNRMMSKSFSLSVLFVFFWSLKNNWICTDWYPDRKLWYLASSHY